MEIPRDWTFKSSEIVSGFDRHVREQLPWYDLATGVVAHVGRHYIPESGTVYDIGASTGNISRAIAETVKSRSARLVSLDNSGAMSKKYSGPVPLTIADATEFEFKDFDFAVLFLVLMFIHPAKRTRLLQTLKEKLRVGGAIIIVDKLLPESGYSATVLSRLALAGKMAAGIDPREILKKELSLAGVQRPLSRNEIGQAVQVFQFGDFHGWIIEG